MSVWWMQPPKMPFKIERKKIRSESYVPWFLRFNDLATHLSLFYTFLYNLRFYHHHFEFSFLIFANTTQHTPQHIYILHSYVIICPIVGGCWIVKCCFLSSNKYMYQHFLVFKIFRSFLLFRKPEGLTESIVTNQNIEIENIVFAKVQHKKANTKKATWTTCQNFC